MTTKTCDVNLLDTDSLLPPRKRLLAGLRRQSSEINPSVPITLINNHETDYDAHVLNLLNSRLSNPNLSNEEIIESSRYASIEASKIAVATRSKAKQKAAIAARAMAVAKNALDLATMLMDEEAAKKEKRLKKNKMKKQETADTPYGKRKGSNASSCRKDEELARELHQVVNSTPRIMKSSYKLGSDTISQKPKRMKSYEKAGVTINSGILIEEGDINNEISEKRR